MTPMLALLQDAAASPGPPPQDPGIVPWIPAVGFLVLAGIVWAIWRKLAE